jgi:tetratricopeptide (TPR) repeat protein
MLARPPRIVIPLAGRHRMSDHLFISYSRADGEAFALRLADELAAGPPATPVWLDQRDIRAGEDWDDQVEEAIRACKGVLFVMTDDGVQSASVCKQEWTRALRYKKPVIPLRVSSDAELPMRLGSREYVDFAQASFESALARLRKHLAWMGSPAGQLQALRHRLADAERELPRAAPERRALVEDDVADLRRQIAQQQAVVDDPGAAQRRVQESIARGLDLARKPAKPVGGVAHGRFINPPPLVAPAWFQDRHVETRLVAGFLKDDALRLITVVGRGGIGKSAMVCRLLRSLERGQLPDDGGPLPVDGIVYLSDARSFHRVNVPDLYDSLTKLLPDDAVAQLDAVYKRAGGSVRDTVQALTRAFPGGRTVVLLDNFEDEVDIETGRIRDVELDAALRALLELPPHGLKVIVTTRVAPGELALVEPGRQRRLDLDTGLESPYAEEVLRAMDSDGKVGLRDAPPELLSEARERTRGYPRALEHLFGILSADRDSSLQEVLQDTRRLLPERVVEVLVGEAFSRLDLVAQRVVQALAVYRYPMPAAAVDYLLQPYVPGTDSARILSRLVNMQFARREAGRYYLHQVDRDYALGRIAAGAPDDRDAAPPPLTRAALYHRAAEWFRQARTPRESWKTLEDLAAPLAEFELRYAGEDYDAAAALLQVIDYDYLQLWGHVSLTIELHERLQGKLADVELRQWSVGNLGLAYNLAGRQERAIACHTQALRIVRERGDRWAEGVTLGNLGTCYADLGQTSVAIDYYEQALAIARAVGDRRLEANQLGNLANAYSYCGETVRAMDAYERALALARDAEDRPGEARHLTNVAGEYGRLGRYDEARARYGQALDITGEIGYRVVEAVAHMGMGEVRRAERAWAESATHYERAIEIGDEIGSTLVQVEARMGLATTYVARGDFATAYPLAEAARRYDVELSNHRAAAVQGVAALRLGDLAAAREAFAATADLARRLLASEPRHFAAQDSAGLALSGLAACGEPERVPAAREAFRAARALNSDAGAVAEILLLFDALAAADGNGILREVRAAAASAPSSAPQLDPAPQGEGTRA